MNKKLKKTLIITYIVLNIILLVGLISINVGWSNVYIDSNEKWCEYNNYLIEYSNVMIVLLKDYDSDLYEYWEELEVVVCSDI